MKTKKIKKTSIFLALVELFLFAGNRANAQFEPSRGSGIPAYGPPYMIVIPLLIDIVLPVILFSTIIIGIIVYILKKVRKKRNAEKISENRDGSNPEILSGQK